MLPVLCTALLVVLAAGPAAQGGLPVAAIPTPARIAPAGTAPADLAVRFETLLGQHSVLAADVMRSRIRGDDDFVQAANAALGRNTEEMTALLRQMFGPAAAAAFAPLWAEHIVSLVEYSAALADQDDAARARARLEVVRYERKLAAFFAGASHGRLPEAAARQAVEQHVQHLTGQADAYAAGDYATADQLYRLGYQHTYDLGLALADALLPAGDRAALRAPLWRLRSQLGKLLAEHVVLVEDVTRAAVTGAPDFQASAEMINGNTRDLVAAMDSLFGARAADRFQSLWSDHVELLVAYASGTAAQNTGRQAAARSGLRGVEQRMTAFLATATGQEMAATELAAALRAHDDMLLEHADAYAARDFPAAYRMAHDTYDGMSGLARQLADAFGVTVAKRLPQGGAQTGYGGLAAAGHH